MKPGINLEFARSEGLELEAALREARELGYRFAEPYLYAEQSLSLNSHLALRTHSPYHHLDAATSDLRRIRAVCVDLGVSLSALDAHSSLLLPQIGVPHLQRALDVAADLDCPVVMSDEGPLPLDWMSLAQAFDLLCLSLEAVIRHAEKRRLSFAIELHNALTAKPEWLLKLLQRFGPSELGVNFDTGNAFLAGNDPVDYLRLVANRVVHVHLKDIPESLLPQRGQVTGTRVGVALGDGVVDIRSVLAVLSQSGYQGVVSVECDNLKQAGVSRTRLETWIAELQILRST